MKCRAGHSHLSGSCLSSWGDKESAAWLIGEFQVGHTHFDCAGGHFEEALPFITNQNFGRDTNAWITWWETNKDKTQEEWIRDGFFKHGVELSRQLTTNNVFALLKIMRTPQKRANNDEMCGAGAFSYNAFRWLREAGVDPHKVDYQSLPIEDRDTIIQGLIIYARYLGIYEDAPGRIFKKDTSFPSQSWFMDWRLDVALAICLILVAICGVLLLRRQTGQ
jgi:hypothetical protein